ncbi:MAG: hypothetical protein HYS87_02250 [Candidatus Colwellbacteria bacterium]|nr:hypothetical protein [Candidatus Colwellbacteria bacterium]
MTKDSLNAVVGKTPWWRRAVFYELYVDKFAGNFRGLADKISYFKTLGVDALHILPHYPSPMVDDGYDVSDYMNIRKNLGTMDDFALFVSQAKDAGIKIMVELPFNHTSVEHPWFLKSKESKTNPYRDYYLWSNTGKELAAAANAFPEIKPSNWVFDKEAGAYFFSTFYPTQPDLNWGNPEVLKEILKVIDFWVAAGVNAFRLDAVSYLAKSEGKIRNLQESHDIIRKIRDHVERKYGDIALLGEVHDTLDVTRTYFGDGLECQLVYNFPLAEAIAVKLVLGEDERLKKIISDLSAPAGSAWVSFIRNHDELSLSTLDIETRERLSNAIDPKRRLRFHGGVSARLADMCLKSKLGFEEAVRTAFGLLLSLPTAAVIYYGDEINMKNADGDAYKDTRRFVRAEFDWEEAEKQIKNPASLFSFIRGKITERRIRGREVLDSRIFGDNTQISLRGV